jgi:hypothetical protein
MVEKSSRLWHLGDQAATSDLASHVSMSAYTSCGHPLHEAMCEKCQQRTYAVQQESA